MKAKTKGADLPFWVYPKWVLREPNLSHACKLVLGLIVILHESEDGCICSNQRLADELAMDVASVRQVLHRLRKAGYLAPVAKSFPHSFSGKRLVPTYHTKPIGVIPYNGDVIPYNAGVIGLHIEQKITEKNKRESREAGLVPEGERLDALVASVVESGGFSPQEVREEVASSAAAVANGLTEAPRAWDLFIHGRLAAKKKLRRLADGPKAAQPRRESQFSKVF